MITLFVSSFLVYASDIQTRNLKCQRPVQLVSPSVIRDDVGVLFKSDRLWVFGVADFGLTRFERLEIYTAGPQPVHLASLQLDPIPEQPFNVVGAEFFHDERLFRWATMEVPELVSHLDAKGLFSGGHRNRNWKRENVRTMQLLQRALQKEEKKSQGVTWQNIRDNLMTQSAERWGQWRSRFRWDTGRKPQFPLSENAKKACNPNPTDKEEQRFRFEGFLPRDGQAIAVIQYDFKDYRYEGARVSINPAVNNSNQSVFLPIHEKIQREGRFELRWLGVVNPVVIELADVEGLRATYIVFASYSDLPEKIPFYVIDRGTGLRMSEKPIIRNVSH